MDSKEILERLVAIDEDYFGCWEEWNADFPADLRYVLATWLYDHDARFDEETQARLKLVADHFGGATRWDVMNNLFERNHDT
jgi:hypothetical protein